MPLLGGGGPGHVLPGEIKTLKVNSQIDFKLSPRIFSGVGNRIVDHILNDFITVNWPWSYASSAAAVAMMTAHLKSGKLPIFHSGRD